MSDKKITDEDVDKIISKKDLTENDVNNMVNWVIDICKEIQKKEKNMEACEGCGCDPCDCDWGN